MTRPGGDGHDFVAIRGNVEAPFLGLSTDPNAPPGKPYAGWRRAARDRKALQQGGRCIYCECRMTRKAPDSDVPCATDATLEHIKPACHGGTFADTNLAASCHTCNQARGNIRHETFLVLRRTVRELTRR